MGAGATKSAGAAKLVTAEPASAPPAESQPQPSGSSSSSAAHALGESNPATPATSRGPSPFKRVPSSPLLGRLGSGRNVIAPTPEKDPDGAAAFHGSAPGTPASNRSGSKSVYSAPVVDSTPQGRPPLPGPPPPPGPPRTPSATGYMRPSSQRAATTPATSDVSVRDEPSTPLPPKPPLPKVDLPRAVQHQSVPSPAAPEPVYQSISLSDPSKSSGGLDKRSELPPLMDDTGKPESQPTPASDEPVVAVSIALPSTADQRPKSSLSARAFGIFGRKADPPQPEVSTGPKPPKEDPPSTAAETPATAKEEGRFSFGEDIFSGLDQIAQQLAQSAAQQNPATQSRPQTQQHMRPSTPGEKSDDEDNVYAPTAASVVHTTDVDDCLNAAREYLQREERRAKTAASSRPGTGSTALNWFAEVDRVLHEEEEDAKDVVARELQQYRMQRQGLQTPQTSYTQSTTEGNASRAEDPSLEGLNDEEKEKALQERLDRVQKAIEKNQRKEDKALAAADKARRMEGEAAANAMTWWMDQRDYLDAKEALEAERQKFRQELLSLKKAREDQIKKEADDAAQAMQLAKDWLEKHGEMTLEELDAEIERLKAEHADEEERAKQEVEGVVSAAQEWLARNQAEEEARLKGTWEPKSGSGIKEEPEAVKKEATQLAEEIEKERVKRLQMERKRQEAAEEKIQRAALDAQNEEAILKKEEETKQAASALREAERRRAILQDIESVAKMARLHDDYEAKTQMEELQRVELEAQAKWKQEEEERQKAVEQAIADAAEKKRQQAMLLARKEAARRKRQESAEKELRRQEDKAKYLSDEKARRIAIQKQHIRGSRMLRVLGGVV